MKTITICCDVDGTLVYDTANNELVPREEIRSLIIALSGMRNVEIYVWSGSGILYAKQVVNQLGLSKRIVDCIEKGSITPDIAIDDMPDADLGGINMIVPDPDNLDTPAESEARGYKKGIQEVLLALSEHGRVKELPDAFFDEFKDAVR